MVHGSRMAGRPLWDHDAGVGPRRLVLNPEDPLECW